MCGTKLGDADLCRYLEHTITVLDKVSVAGGGASEVTSNSMGRSGAYAVFVTGGATVEVGDVTAGGHVRMMPLELLVISGLPLCRWLSPMLVALLCR